jgi:hypothetical protein
VKESRDVKKMLSQQSSILKFVRLMSVGKDIDVEN